MSTTPPPPPPPERPTEPLAAVRPAPTMQAPPVAPAVDPNVILLRLEDAIGSLRTGLMIVGAIAVAALGVATYALFEGDGGGASDGGAGVSQIEDRVDRLSRQVQSARAGGGGGGETAALETRIGALERTVRTLADRPAAADATQAIEQLSGRIDTLAQDVEELQQAQTTP